jgi:hypothetical protein
VAVVQRADPADPVVMQIADAVLNGKPLDRDYYVSVVLDRLETGLDAGNVLSPVLRPCARPWFTTDRGEYRPCSHVPTRAR